MVWYIEYLGYWFPLIFIYIEDLILNPYQTECGIRVTSAEAYPKKGGLLALQFAVQPYLTKTRHAAGVNVWRAIFFRWGRKTRWSTGVFAWLKKKVSPFWAWWWEGDVRGEKKFLSESHLCLPQFWGKWGFGDVNMKHEEVGDGIIHFREIFPWSDKWAMKKPWLFRIYRGFYYLVMWGFK